jgi:hypothetical protein
MKLPTFLLTSMMALGSVSAGQAADLGKIDVSKLPPPSAAKGLTYEKDIKPLLDASCTRCHGQDRPKAGLQLTSLDGLLKGGKEGKVVVPGDSTKSILVIAAAQIDDEIAMPPKPRAGHGPGGPGGNRPPGGQPPAGGPGGQRPPGGPGGPGGFGPPPKPLTAAQVSVLRAWVDQGAK